MSLHATTLLDRFSEATLLRNLVIKPDNLVNSSQQSFTRQSNLYGVLVKAGIEK